MIWTGYGRWRRVRARRVGFAVASTACVGLTGPALGAGSDTPDGSVVINGAQIQLGITLTGDTSDNTDFSDSGVVGACSAGSAPDEWYRIQIGGPTGTIGIDIELCGTGTTYDSKVFVLDTAATVLTCDDDGCGVVGGPSRILNLTLAPGTYELAIDGFGTSSGVYSASISEFAPIACFLDPPCFGDAEGEPCEVGPDVTNGGCNSTPEVFGTITVDGPAVCGTAWANDGSRDTDWYAFSVAFTQAVEIEVRGETDLVAFLTEMSAGGACPVIGTPEGTPAFSGDCDGVHIIGTGYVLDPGDYALFVAPGTETSGGVFQGFPCTDGSTTDNAYEVEIRFGPEPTGACCLGATCVEAFPSDCAASGGFFQGIGSLCAGTTCPFGACCLPDGGCRDGLTASQCASVGIYQGDETLCVGVFCVPPPPTGACCFFPSGVCIDGQTPSGCASAGGVYQGDDLTCGEVTCPVPATGACCIGASCIEGVTPAACANADGIYQGDDTICEATTCFAGACCFIDGSCLVGDAAGCASAGGAYQGDRTDCASVTCPVGPTGACCLPGDECSVVTGATCVSSAGFYLGDATGCGSATCPPPGLQQPATCEIKISDLAGGFGGALFDGDGFGAAAAEIGDLDGDGWRDMIIGAPGDDDGGNDRGAVWVLFMNGDGTVASEVKISDTAGGFDGALFDGDGFGSAVTGIGDLNGDGVPDVAVGAPFSDEPPGLDDEGAVWLLFMNANGTVASESKIANTSGGFGGTVGVADFFGSSVAAIGDVDGNGIMDLAAGAPGRDLDGADDGAVWIVFMAATLEVQTQTEITEGQAGFGGALAGEGRFGASVTALGDLNFDGVDDVAVGEPLADGALGSVWVLFLVGDGSVISEQEITAGVGGLGDVLQPGDEFGSAVERLVDLDGNGVVEIGVGAAGSDLGTSRGALWIVFMKGDGTVLTQFGIAAGVGGFTGNLDPGDRFGEALAMLSDNNGDGLPELAIGAPFDDDGGGDRGAAWILCPNGLPNIALGPPQEFPAAGPGVRHVTAVLDTTNISPAGIGTLDLLAVIPDADPKSAGVVQVFIAQIDAGQGFTGFDLPAPTYTVGVNPTGAAVADFDGDGYNDVAVTNAGSNTVSILLNDANDQGTLTLFDTVGGLSMPSDVAAGDFIADGGNAIDLAVTNEGNDTVVILENDGDGNFVPADALPAIPVGTRPVALDPIDLDNDKDVDDVIVVNNSGNSASALANGGGGSFVRTDIPVGPEPVEVAAGDFDGDTKDDIAVANKGDGTISVARNAFGAGPGPVFDPPVAFTLAGGPLSVVAADVTGDGLPDLISIADDPLGTGRAVYAQANGFGVGGNIAFSAPIAFDALADPNFVKIADFNGDGLLDVATVNTDSGGPSTGSVTVFISIPRSPGGSCTADLNGNNVVDFADVLLIIAAWGPCPGCPEDLDGSGDVGFGDILVVIGSWGACP
ncbi:MAG: hypothetical protein GY715_20990 [Planctomycetes bacterium]|nr:hypothetical protein [Planctomycetota bacterium]